MRLILRSLGYIVLISAIFMILPIITAFAYNESALPFIVSAAVRIAVGGALLLIRKDEKKNQFTLSKGLMLTALSFIVLSIIGCTSFLPVLDWRFDDALFESVSGLTTTGLTVFNDVEALPRSMLLWRAETQWIGGIGIVTFFLFILSMLRSPSRKESERVESINALYHAQGFSEGVSSMRKTIFSMIKIYIIFTIAGALLLWVAKLPLFEAVSIAFTSISTGGFSVTNGFYSGALHLIIIAVLMLAGATSFVFHDMLFRGKIREFFKNIEMKYFFIFVIVASALSFVAFRNVGKLVFQIISAFTTTGFSVVEISSLPALVIMVLTFGMIIGGSIASTAGGVKLFRFIYLIKSIPWFVKKLLSPPTAVIPFKLEKKGGNSSIDEPGMLVLHLFISTYVLLIFLGIVILMFSGLGFFDAAFQIISAIGTVGLQTLNIASTNLTAKIVLMLAMLLGRLEIFPILLLLRRLFRK